MFGREKGTNLSNEEVNFEVPENEKSLSNEDLDVIVKSTEEYQELNELINGLSKPSEQIPCLTEVKSVDYVFEADYKREMDKLYDEKMKEAKKIATQLEKEDGVKKIKESLDSLRKVEKQVSSGIELREKLLKELGIDSWSSSKVVR